MHGKIFLRPAAKITNHIDSFLVKTLEKVKKRHVWPEEKKHVWPEKVS